MRRRLRLARRPIRLSAMDAVLLDRVLDGLAEFNRIMSVSAPGSRLLEPEGIVAVVMPAVPERALMNAVVYQRPGALAAALDQLTTSYHDAGVESWMVLAPAVDGEARKLLKHAGHFQTGSGTALARHLGGVQLGPGQTSMEWTADGDPAAMAAICDRAFSSGNAFARAFSGMPRKRARVYLASLDGEPASCVMMSDHDGNCAVELTATVPEARRRGLSGALLGRALSDAARRGCETTTVVASPLGEVVYRRLGYRPVCPIQYWVRTSKSSE